MLSAEHNQVARLFRLAPGVTLAETEFRCKPLLIQNNEIKFLCEALRGGCEFTEMEWPKTDAYAAESGELWRLKFFMHSRFASELYVWISSAQSDSNSLSSEHLDRHSKSQYTACLRALKLENGQLFDAARAVWQPTLGDSALENASILMRGTKSLKQDEYQLRADRWLAIEPRGFSLFAKQESAPHLFRRYLILLALLNAYQWAIDSASQALASWAASESREHRSPHPQRGGAAFAELATLRRDCLLFAARFLFARPVRLDTVDLRYVWDALAQAQHLADSQQELNDQLSAMHGLLADEESQREEARDKRREKVLTMIGFVLTVLSLLSLISITPTTLQQFWQAWFGSS